MCYSCREFNTEDEYNSFDYYNLNLIEYKNLSYEVFNDCTLTSSISDSINKKE